MLRETLIRKQSIRVNCRETNLYILEHERLKYNCIQNLGTNNYLSSKCSHGRQITERTHELDIKKELEKRTKGCITFSFTYTCLYCSPFTCSFPLSPSLPYTACNKVKNFPETNMYLFSFHLGNCTS